MKNKKKINDNGFDYVDLGLPSGTLWATCNVGAKDPSDYGLYFQWGDTQGCTIDKVGIERGQKSFSLTDYKFNPSGDGETFTKYKDKNAKLELEDDAAHVNMGGDWHMPTPTQIRELLDNTTSEWTALNDVNGMKFTSKKDTSKSIFIPAAGGAWVDSVDNCGEGGCIWSSVLNTCSARSGQYLYFYQESAFLSYSYFRCGGLSVRGVIG